MNATRDDLHDLHNTINSLSQTEKTHFRKFSTLYAETANGNFIQLYNAMDSIKQFDVLAIQEALNSPETEKNIKQAIHFLNKRLMSSLRAYHSSISVETKQKNTLRNLDILYSKGHFTQCKKILDKSKKEAYKYEKFNCILALLDWEKKLISKYVDYKKQTAGMQLIFDELNKVIEKKNNLYQIELAFNSLYGLVKKANKVRNEEELYSYNNIIRNKAFNNNQEILSFNAEVYWQFIKAGIYFISNEMTKALPLVEQRMSYLNKRPKLVKDDPHHFINVMGNVLSCRNSLNVLATSNYKNNKNAFFRILKNLNCLEANTSELQVKVFSNVIIHELGFYINTGNFKKAVSISISGEKELKSLPRKLGKASELCFHYYSAYAYFGCGKHEVAMIYITQVLSNDYADIRIDLQCFARILHLLIRMENNNLQQWPQSVKEAVDFLTTHDRLFPIEKSILQFFAKASTDKLPDKKKISALKVTLQKKAKEKFADNFDEFSHFMWWLDSKISDDELSNIIDQAITKQ